MVHIYNSSLLQFYFFLYHEMLLYTLSYVIMFCHGVYLVTAERKESRLTAAAVSDLDLQALFVAMIVIISSSSKITVFIKTLVFFIHTDHVYMSRCGYYRQIQYLTVMYHHSNSVTYISRCKHS